MPQQLPKDRPTAADKKREADLVKALEKEDFFGKKKKPQSSAISQYNEIARQNPPKRVSEPAAKPPIKVTSVKMKIDRPTAADKKREQELIRALEKERFYESPLMRAAKAKKQ
jgi:hypothetical protein